MFETDLVPGDVIFFENSYHDGGTYVDHVAMYAGSDERGSPMLIHSVAGDHPYYFSEKVSGLCYTTLRALKNQVQREAGYADRQYDVNFQVFRFANSAINQKALEILQTQATYRIPYDEKRLQAKLAREDDPDHPFEAEDFKNLALRQYVTEGRYRSLKYAARYPNLLTRTCRNGIGRGLTCSMTVVLAFQIAELLIDNKISVNANGYWPSDKYALIPTYNTYPAAYLNYINGLREHISENRPQESHLRLSYSFWHDPNSPLENYTHTTLPVDSKVIGAAGLFCYMQGNGLWKYQGILQAHQRFFSPTEKELNQMRNRHSYFRSLENIERLCTRNPALISPGSSSESVDDNETSCLDGKGGANWYSDF